MFDWVEKIVRKIWQLPLGRYVRMRRHEEENNYNGQWSMDLEQHAFGEHSFSVVQSNRTMEDFSQVKVGHNATFVGVYDGHGGHEAAWFVRENLFNNLSLMATMAIINTYKFHSFQVGIVKHVMINPFIFVVYEGLAQEKGGLISEQMIRNAIAETEDEFIYFARKGLNRIPNIYAIGSCCLVGLIWNKKLFLGNLGDSRAVLGRAIKRRLSKIIAGPLTKDHNARMEEVRRELQIDHPYDPDIVVRDNEHDIWRIKGIIQISRSIGDLYLKKPEFAINDQIFPHFHLNEPIHKPILRSDPIVHRRDIQPADKFVVFASDGLWEHLSDQKAINIVQKYPRYGIAKRPVKKALEIAAKKQGRRYKDVRRYEMGRRRTIHDDITVVVLFIDHELVARSALVPEVSVKAFAKSTESQFKYIHGGASTSGG